LKDFALPYRYRPYLAGLITNVRNHAFWLHQQGSLPSVLIIGAQKAGTTSLFDILSQHPEISTSKMKEVHFADRNWWRGQSWYKRCFPKTPSITMEATPNYLFAPFAAERMMQVVPDARCIAILRNPIERAYSHYKYEYRRGGERYSFEDALAAEAERTDSDWARAELDPEFWSFALQHQSYMRRGLYAAHLAKWEAILPRNRLLVIEDQDIFQMPRLTLEKIQAFIGVTQQKNLCLSHKNKGVYKTKKPQFPRTLTQYFTDDGKALKARYGARFSWLLSELA